MKLWLAKQPTHVEAVVATAVGAVQGAALGGLMGTLTPDGGAPFPVPQLLPGADPKAMASFKQAQVFCDSYLDGGYHVLYAHTSGLQLQSYETLTYERVSVQTCESAPAEQDDFDRLGTKAIYGFVYPNFMINRYGPWMDTNLAVTLDATRCKVVFDYFPDKSLLDDQNFIERSLKDSDQVQNADASIRKRALELVFLLANYTDGKPLIKEFVSCLVVADPDFKKDLAAKIYSTVEKFSQEKLWHLDYMFKVLSLSFNSSDSVFCGVFDGHGPYGHFVAKKVRESLPVKLRTQWKTSASGSTSPHQNGSISGSMNSEETASVVDDEWVESVDADGSEKLPEMFLPLKQSYFKAFKLMDEELKLHPTIDCFCSGTTAVTLVKQGWDLVVGNLGDSRAIMGTRDASNNLTAVQLTVDLKPNLPREAARIQQRRGRVFALQDEPEVARVWLPNNNSPGLAMARAFGDFCLKDYGLISVPEICYRRLTEKDEFIILASDGVWDVLSNKEAVDIVASAPSRATAARALVDCAVRSWRLKFPTSKSDDCAVVCLFLDQEKSTDMVQESEHNKETAEPIAGAIPDASAKVDQNIADVNVHISSVEQITEPTLEHTNTLRDVDEIVPVDEPPVSKEPERCSLADCISTNEEEEWSALEGVTRVNSLFNLPRILSGDKRSTSWRKRL